MTAAISLYLHMRSPNRYPETDTVLLVHAHIPKTCQANFHHHQMTQRRQDHYQLK